MGNTCATKEPEDLEEEEFQEAPHPDSIRLAGGHPLGCPMPYPGMPPIIKAAAEENWTAVHDLITEGADPCAKEKLKDWTVMHYAAFHGHIPTVKELLSKGADYQAMNADGNMPQHVAQLNGRKSVDEFFQKYLSLASSKSQTRGSRPIEKRRNSSESEGPLGSNPGRGGNTKQYFEKAKSMDRKLDETLLVLHKLLRASRLTQVVIYCNTQKSVASISEALRGDLKLRDNHVAILSCHSKEARNKIDTTIMDMSVYNENSSTRAVLVVDNVEGWHDVLENVPVVINADFPATNATWLYNVRASGAKVMCSLVANEYEMMELEKASINASAAHGCSPLVVMPSDADSWFAKA